MKTTKITMMFCVAVVLVLPSLAVKATPLGTVDIVRTGHGASQTVTVFGGGLEAELVDTGVYMLNKSASTDAGDIWPDGALAGFCIELEEPAPYYTATYDVEAPENVFNGLLSETLGTGKADALSELWGRYYSTSWEGSGSFTAQENSDAAAFGAAVWEIIYEDLPNSSLDWNVHQDSTPGIPGFSASGLDDTLANNWLHSLDGTGPKASLAAFTNDGNQNYVVAVPEPTTIVLLGLGGALSLVRKRKRTVA
jgi:hypothetical protein